MSSAPAAAAVFVPLTAPVRVYDARWKSVPGVLTGPIAGSQSRVVSIKDSRDPGTGSVIGADAVPADASAVAYNVTVTGATATGFLAAAPGDQGSQPAVSTINWSPGLTAANATSGKVAADRTMKFFAGSGSGGQTLFVVDVVGYFVPPWAVPSGAIGAEFVAMAPLRAYDSRSANPGGPLVGNPSGGNVAAGRTTSAGLDKAVPTGASAVAFNLTITGGVGSGFVEVTPGGKPSSGTSTINWTSPNTTTANGSVVGINAAREQTAYTGGAHSTQYLIDIAGYYRPVLR